MRPLAELMEDAEKAASANVMQLLITAAELRQLKDYELVVGTSNPDVAVFAGPDAPAVPAGFKLLVRRQ